MEIDNIMQYFVLYGPIAIYVIVLLEYLNLPGFPAGVIMPLAGIWTARGGTELFCDDGHHGRRGSDGKHYPLRAGVGRW